MRTHATCAKQQKSVQRADGVGCTCTWLSTWPSNLDTTQNEGHLGHLGCPCPIGSQLSCELLHDSRPALLPVPLPHQMSDSLLYRRSTTSGAMYERLPVVSV